MDIISIPSPNFRKGRNGYKPEAIVIHIMEGSLSGTDSWFKSPASKVSAHYGIGLNGGVHRYVAEKDTAWHAGRVYAPGWKLIKPAGAGSYINPNFYTIGIEHEGSNNSDWTEAMYATSAELIKDICNRWNIKIDREHIIGHHEIYALKTCPGQKVDLNKLIALAADRAPAPLAVNQSPALHPGSGKVTTQTRLNIRSAPNTRLPANKLVEPGIQLTYDGYTDNGEAINGNSKWYYTQEGNWFWSGGAS